MHQAQSSPIKPNQAQSSPIKPNQAQSSPIKPNQAALCRDESAMSGGEAQWARMQNLDIRVDPCDPRFKYLPRNERSAGFAIQGCGRSLDRSKNLRASEEADGTSGGWRVGEPATLREKTTEKGELFQSLTDISSN